MRINNSKHDWRMGQVADVQMDSLCDFYNCIYSACLLDTLQLLSLEDIKNFVSFSFMYLSSFPLKKYRGEGFKNKKGKENSIHRLR